MASFNKVILMGRLTAAPELKQTPSGTSVCTFTIAVDRKYKAEDGKAQADFLQIVTWRQTAEFVAKYFSKGASILVCGQIQTRSWTDNHGVKKYATEIIADEVAFAGDKVKDDQANGQQAQPPVAPQKTNTEAVNNAAEKPAEPYSQGDFEKFVEDQDMPF